MTMTRSGVSNRYPYASFHSPWRTGNHRFLSGVLGRKKAEACANMERPSIPDRSVCTKPLPIYRGLNTEIGREGQAAVLEKPGCRAEERAWNGEPHGIDCRDGVKGATWTQLSLSL